MFIARTRSQAKREKSPLDHIVIRQMEIDDLYDVWKLGESLYDKLKWANLYRTWDVYCVTETFNTDSEFCLVAEIDDKVIGFAMGNTIKKASWKYGHFFLFDSILNLK
jgi:ribosomal protein S18 acetylase RimI-like enzyme